jgi:hypothetical protein
LFPWQNSSVFTVEMPKKHHSLALPCLHAAKVCMLASSYHHTDHNWACHRVWLPRASSISLLLPLDSLLLWIFPAVSMR